MLRAFGSITLISFCLLVSAAVGTEPLPPDNGSIDVPVRLSVLAPEKAIAARATVDVEVEVTALVSLASAELSFAAEGPVELIDDGPVALGAVGAGESVVVPIPAYYTEEGRSAVHVKLLATSPEGYVYEKNAGLYTILRDGVARTGDGGFLRIELAELEESQAQGFMSAADVDAARRELIRLPVEEDDTPLASSSAGAFAGAGVEFGLAPAAGRDEETVPDEGGAAARSAVAANITVEGTIQWRDENGNLHPAFGMTVEVRDDELIGSELVAADVVDMNGEYSFVVDNDDGIGAGNRDIFVRIRTANSAVSIETAGILGAPYEADSSVTDEVPDNATVVKNLTCANTGTGPSCGLTNGATWVARYAAILNSNTYLGQIVLEWPGSTTSANYDGSDINLRPGDLWDWDVMFHEYGHYVMDTFNFENNPGGPHNIGDCIADVQMSKSNGVRLAWGEGWPTFFGTAAQEIQNLASLNVPRVGDVSYADTGESNFSYSLESQDNLGLGEDNEIAVQRMLWDVYDGPADSRDTLTVSDQTLFDRVNAADPTTLSAGWNALRAPLSNSQDLAYGAVATDHFVGPALTSPTAGTIVGLSNKTFNWTSNVGCNPLTFGGDGFDLIFYDDSTLAKILTIPGLGTTSYELTNGELATLIAANHSVRWAVEGSNSSGPATGPYLGENFAITVNRPPVANAGPDQNDIECTSPAGASATLDGSGSSDPDGDSLTYLWSAPGIVFDDATSVSPTATFPKTTTAVNLSVNDGFESDADQMSVEVVDTTPPVIVCPSDVVIECTEFGGVPATHPQVIAFLNGVSATDVCDVSPFIGGDAPGFFPLGDTVVTFTATDDDGNSSDCMATVTVEDTTPPDISVGVSPNVLWPPNHQLVPIDASVEVMDICDPMPTFALTSIVSDEPDDDTGDGATSPDFAGAAIGTADTSFELRAERDGAGDGRTYTILYTGSDGSGNTADDSDVVNVPQSQKK